MYCTSIQVWFAPWIADKLYVLAPHFADGTERFKSVHGTESCAATSNPTHTTVNVRCTISCSKRAILFQNSNSAHAQQRKHGRESVITLFPENYYLLNLFYKCRGLRTKDTSPPAITKSMGDRDCARPASSEGSIWLILQVRSDLRATAPTSLSLRRLSWQRYLSVLRRSLLQDIYYYYNWTRIISYPLS